MFASEPGVAGVRAKNPVWRTGVPSPSPSLTADNLNLGYRAAGGAVLRRAEFAHAGDRGNGDEREDDDDLLIHQMLNALGIRCGLIGTVVIDDGVEVAAASLTTPPALEVSRTFGGCTMPGVRRR